MGNLPAWASVGYQAVEQRSQEIERAMTRQNYLPSFILKGDEEAVIRFLTYEPICINEHFLPNAKGQKNFTCLQGTGEECPLCAAGLKPRFVGAYIILDTRHESWEKNGEKKTRENTIKLAKWGVRSLKVISKMHSKRGLASFDWEATRTGSGTDTQYTFLPTDKVELPAEVLEAIKGTNWQERLLEEIKPMSNSDLRVILAGGTVRRDTDGNPKALENPPWATNMGDMDENEGVYDLS
jgi:hypothetical protein